MKPSKKFLILLNIIAVMLLCLSYLAPLVDPAKLRFFSLFGLLYPVCLSINIFFACLWMFIDLKWSLLSALTLLAGYEHFNKLYAFNSPKSVVDPDKISIVSYNIGNAFKVYNKDPNLRKEQSSKMVNFLSRFTDEDIVCIQEVGGYATDIINKSLPTNYKHQTDKGAVILSKHPIIDKGIVEFGTLTNSCVWADIKIGLDTIRVYSVHLKSNVISTDANQLIDNPEIDNNRTWLHLQGIFTKYIKTHHSRTIQAKKLLAHAEESPYRVIISGDMNDTPLTYTYHLFNNKYIDNFTASGNGLGTSFNGKLPLLRIDYIFTDSSFQVYNFNTIRQDFSDHFPIASIIGI